MIKESTYNQTTDEPGSSSGSRIKLFLLILCTLFIVPLRAAENPVERNDTLPPDNNRYLYIKKQLTVEFRVTLHPQQNSYFGPLLHISSNENEYMNLFLDYQRGELRQLLFYSRSNIRKLPVPVATDTLATAFGFPVKIEFRQQQKEFTLQVGDSLYHISNLGFDPKAGYKFNFPTWEIQPMDGSGNRSIQVSGVRFIQTSDRKVPNTIWYWFIFILVIDLIIFGGVQLRKRKLRRKQQESAATPIFTDMEEEEHEMETPLKSAIYLFGGFHIYDTQGNNITRKFTPLLKELLLLILIHTPKQGISSEKLREILWFDKSEQSAKNNRAVNMGKLRSLLETLGEVGISNKNGNWELEINNEEIYVDYFEYINLYNRRPLTSREDVSLLFRLTRQGAFLTSETYDWLDRYKASVTDFIIDTLVNYAGASVQIDTEPAIALRIADSIYPFDPLNESALRLRVKAYSALGKHSLAKKAMKDSLKITKRLTDRSSIALSTISGNIPYLYLRKIKIPLYDRKSYRSAASRYSPVAAGCFPSYRPCHEQPLHTAYGADPGESFGRVQERNYPDLYLR
ncbi:MAG: hypothetical protein LUE93_14380 [Bacteroides sp.]|nr:hypothetical protein [Bacteroides sp.]